MPSKKFEFQNPFRPGAGHPPPYLAGRSNERAGFTRLLGQDTILENFVLTGLRGVGKTVLFETFKPIAHEGGWYWVGTDLSESATITETTLATRVLTDLSVVTASFEMEIQSGPNLFNKNPQTEIIQLDYEALVTHFRSTPGLISDKLKSVLELVWKSMPNEKHGIVFAYDEAQILADHAGRDEYPLSVLLEVFQSIQKKNIRFMLALTGLPTLFPKLVEARTYSERMFHVVFLERLNKQESKDAITIPLKDAHLQLSDDSVDTICKVSGGYPYFVQFICREVYDLFIQRIESGNPLIIPIDSILRKLDSDFFAGRWAKATDRQRDLLWVIAQLPNADSEFSVQEIADKSIGSEVKRFGASHINQMLVHLSEAGLIFKNRHGKYSFAVPLLGEFIKRQGKPD